MTEFHMAPATAAADAGPAAPFARFAAELRPQSPLRAAITAAYRRPEPACMAALLDAATLTPAQAEAAAGTARRLVEALRAKQRHGGVEGLIQEYDLSSQEGVALMCLAEALLRIPDDATRDALIRDKISTGDWRAHLGRSPSLFVNAATWGLVVTGKLTATSSESSLGAALTRLIARGGEPLIRRGTDLAMRMMGEQFVTGQTIEEALAKSRKHEAKGFRYSYDMLGEAATTAEDAARYLADYEHAIHAIGKAAAGRGIYEGPGISIKLSALHPRYSRLKRARVMAELLPRVKRLAALARSYAIGLNIDAEEADRLEISLDLLQSLALDPDLAGWNGIGFVLQAYGKRCPYAIDFVVDLARRAGRRIMVRLVKGAYWDSEIKRAQVDGLDGFPVFTRKVHTDVSYLACAHRLLAAPDAVFPQFATHNAATLAAIVAMAGPDFHPEQYEFQCLHGMGETLYDEVVGKDKLGRPCRIYAPVGTHETLLAYLVRRLLENGANSSFVNRIADEQVSIEELIADPVAAEERAACLARAADAMEARMPVLIGLIVREAGKSYPNAIAEVREAVDFLRYYGVELIRTVGGERHAARGPIVCISPWNFPLAIFTGQVAAALAAGNPVLAKPAEETPLIAAEATRLLHAAGVPAEVLQLLPGAGEVGAALVADARVMGVMFTGSTAVARLIQARLAGRLTPDGRPIPLIAETGGQNAMIVDSSALAEQVVADVIASAFDSAGQRCSALRILCLQEDVAERTLAMLQGAMRELELGDPQDLSVDVGPVITAEAQAGISSHVAAMRARGHRVASLPLPPACGHGTFVAPTIIEIARIDEVEREVFGPVLHVLRFRRENLDRLVAEINATGYGLTFGLHTRIDETIARVVGRVEAGNIYVNRNVIGAVVGVQPFGGAGLSGTGPKAGGPLYLGRLLARQPAALLHGLEGAEAALRVGRAYADWLAEAGHAAEAERCLGLLARSPLGARVELPGPVGERNLYLLRPRGRVAAVSADAEGLRLQVGAILATGNVAVLEQAAAAKALAGVPAEVAARIVTVASWREAQGLRALLFDGTDESLLALARQVAEQDGPILSIEVARAPERDDYELTRLLEECTVSTNTAAAGGNASLMTIG